MRLLLFILLLISAIQGNTQTIQISLDDIKYIYDGDTFFVVCPECDKGKQGVRVMGVDTPEIRGHCQQEKILARAAKQAAVGLIRGAKQITLIPNPKRRYDRYNRLLATVLLDDQDLADQLIRTQHGRAYHGEKRQGWCDDE